jgi:MFS family permease
LFSSLNRNNKLVFVALALWGVGEGLWWYLLPVYIEGLGATPVQIGMTLSIAMIVMTLCFIPSGWIADRFSRRWIMIGGWVMGTIAILVLAAAQTWQMAIPGLILYNLSAFNMPAMNAYVTAEIKSGHDVRRAFTTVFSGFTFGMVFSPAVGGVLADIWGIRPLLFLAFIAFALSTFFILLIKDQPIHRAHVDQPPQPLSRNRPFIALCATLGVSLLVAHLGVPLASNFLRDARGLNMGIIGALGSINSVGSLVLTLGLGRWPKSRTAALVLSQGTAAAYSAIMLTVASVPALGLAMFLRGGIGAFRQLGAARLGELMPVASMGMGYGVFQTMVNLAFTISPYVAGWLYAANPFYPFAASLVLSLPTMLLMTLVGRRLPAHRPAEAAAPAQEAL